MVVYYYCGKYVLIKVIYYVFIMLFIFIFLLSILEIWNIRYLNGFCFLNLAYK